MNRAPTISANLVQDFSEKKRAADRFPVPERLKNICRYLKRDTNLMINQLHYSKIRRWVESL